MCGADLKTHNAENRLAECPVAALPPTIAVIISIAREIEGRGASRVSTLIGQESSTIITVRERAAQLSDGRTEAAPSLLGSAQSFAVSTASN